MNIRRSTQLTEQELKHLMARYYDGEKATDLIEEFQLDIAPPHLIQLFPIRILGDMLCPYCSEPMHQRPPSRAALRRGRSMSTPFCTRCKHKNAESCKCKNCKVNIREQHVLQHQELIKQLLNLRHPERTSSIRTRDLSFRQAFFLVCLGRAGRYEEDTLIRSIQCHEISLAPTKDFAIKIVRFLFNQKLINIAASPLEYFVLDDSGDISTIWDQIQFDPHLGVEELENACILYRLKINLLRQDRWSAAWREDLLEMWRELALQECLGYLDSALSSHGLACCDKTKILQVLSSTLKTNSILEICNFIQKAVDDAAGHLLKEGTSHQQAIDIVIRSIQKSTGRAVDEESNVKLFPKDSRCRKNIMAMQFAHILSLDEHYFTAVPSEPVLVI